VLGSTLGVGVGLVGGAAAAGYAATRGDRVGEAARKSGGIALSMVDRAKEINEKHHIAEKAMDAGGKAVAKAKETDEKYGISTKVSQGIGTAVRKVGEIEEKHKVTDKVASGISAGLGRLSQLLEKRSTGASSSAAPGQT